MNDGFTMYETMSVGAVIGALKRCREDAQVRFDFGYMCPTTCDSYRGYYDHLAIGFVEGTWPTVSVVLERLHSSIGKVFEGWKGGAYIMGMETPLWVANPGEATGTAILGLTANNGTVVIRTGHVE